MTLAEVQTFNVYNPLSHIACPNEIEESIIDVTLGHDTVEMEGVADLPAPHNTKGWLGPYHQNRWSFVALRGTSKLYRLHRRDLAQLHMKKGDPSRLEPTRANHLLLDAVLRLTAFYPAPLPYWAGFFVRYFLSVLVSPVVAFVANHGEAGGWIETGLSTLRTSRQI